MAKTFDTSDSLTAASLMFNGGRLTMARQLSGLKKSHLASMVGMSPASVTSWENGSKQPNRQTVAKLAFALKVEPHFFRGEHLYPQINHIFGHFALLPRSPGIKPRRTDNL